jgi:hypothetical protein
MSLPDLSGKALELDKLQKLYHLQDLWNSYAMKNLFLVGSAPQSEFVTFVNPNLYKIALKYYGNANLWTVIANANRLTDPKQTGFVSLLIPPSSSVAETGGILNP